MKTAFEMTTLEQLRAFSHPVRYQILNLLALKPMTGSQLARALKMPRQRIHYHVKILREAGLIVQVEAPEIQAPVEIYYRSVAENFSSPLLVNIPGSPDEAEVAPDVRSQTLREISLTLVEQVKADLQQLHILRKIAGLRSPFQHAVFLTAEQEKETYERFQAIKRDIIRLSEENLTDSNCQDCRNIRYTLLITPSYTGDEE